MKLQRWARTTLMIALGLLVILLSSAITRRIHAQTRRQALTYYQTEKFMTKPGVYGRVQDSVHAIRNDGSTAEARIVMSPNDTPAEMRVVHDMAALRRVSIDGLTKSKTTYAIQAQAAASALSKPRTCSKDPQAPHSRLLGYDVVLDKRELPGEDRAELWRSPELDCLPLLQKFANADGLVYDIREVTSIRFMDPDPVLFSIPADYVERSPQQVMEAFNQLYPQAPPTNPASYGIQQLNGVYSRNVPR